MSLNLTMPERTELKPRITVIGVGGAGGNAVNNMIGAHLEGVEYVVANTDSQALGLSMTDRTIQLGANLTQALVLVPVRKSVVPLPWKPWTKSWTTSRAATWSLSQPVWAVVQARVQHL